MCNEQHCSQQVIKLLQTIEQIVVVNGRARMQELVYPIYLSISVSVYQCISISTVVLYAINNHILYYCDCLTHSATNPQRKQRNEDHTSGHSHGYHASSDSRQNTYQFITVSTNISNLSHDPTIPTSTHTGPDPNKVTRSVCPIPSSSASASYKHTSGYSCWNHRTIWTHTEAHTSRYVMSQWS